MLFLLPLFILSLLLLRTRSNTLPSRKAEEEREEKEEVDEEATEEGKKAAELKKPKAMEFWESMENIERTDFR